MLSLTNLSSLDFLKVTQYAAIEAYKWRGCGNKISGDSAAVTAMREVFNTIPALGVVVVGEGEKDEAPMLYIGEHVGKGDTLLYDVVVDPLEGTTLLANGKPNAISVMGIAPHGSILSVKESFYMEKLVLPNNVAKVVDINAPLEDILKETAKVLGKSISELVVFVLEKPRHKNLIASIHALGAKVQLHTDGDVAGSLFAIRPDTDIDIMMGIGGTPEGVLTACAIQASGTGKMFARYAPQSEEEREALLVAEINTTDYLTAESLVSSTSVLFIATGVTNGQLLDGVSKKSATTFDTDSLLIDGINKRTLSIKETISL